MATMLYSDWAADDMETYRERLLDLFDTENVTAFTARAFGYSTGIGLSLPASGDQSGRYCNCGPFAYCKGIPVGRSSG